MTGPDGKTYVSFSWVLGIVMVCLLGMIGAWAAAMDMRVKALEAQQHTDIADHEILLRLDRAMEGLTKKVDGLYQR